ncbi:MAG: hypothetical protein II836_09980, partial [Clostridia bacterium]|nr:hypothetical protein [Clostridia bacterium]
MKIIVSGILGHMGGEVLALAEKGVRGASAVGGVDPMISGTPSLPVPAVPSFAAADADPELAGIFRSADCIVDFSRHDGTPARLDYALKYGIPAVIATTGHTEEETAKIREAAQEIPVFFSAICPSASPSSWS